MKTANGKRERVSRIIRNAVMYIDKTPVCTHLYVTSSNSYEILFGVDVIDRLDAYVRKGVMYYVNAEEKEDKVKTI